MSLVAEWSTYRQQGSIKTGSHSIEIIDSSGGLNGTFEIPAQNGFELNLGGKPKNLWPTVQPGSLRFTMCVENSIHENFVKSIPNITNISQYIVVYKRGVRPVFVGVIEPEAITYVKSNSFLVDGVRKINGLFNITAVDGLTILKQVNWYEGQIALRRTIIDWIVECLERMPTYDYLFSNALLFQTSWVPDTGTANFVLNQQISARSMYEKIQRLGGTTPNNYYNILEAICEGFNMRCLPSYGFYFFQQLDDPGAVGYLYDRSGGFTGTQPITSIIQDADVDGLNLMDPHIESYSTPIKESKVTYEFSFNPNLANGVKFDHTAYAESCLNNLSVVSIKNIATRLRIIGSLEYTPTITGGFSGQQVRPVFWLKIKIGNYYYARELLTSGQYFYYNYKTPEWTTTESRYYEIPGLITLPDSDKAKFFHTIYFSTLYVPQAVDNEQFSICFGHELYDINNTKIFETSVVVEAILDDLDITPIDVENNVVERTSIDAYIPNAFRNRTKIERTIHFSTGPNESSPNRITDDSVPPVSTLDWTVPGLGTDIHYKQLVKSLASRGMTGNTFMETLIEGPYQSLVRLRACGAVWQWWTGKYYHDNHEEYHKGEFLQLSLDPVDIEVETEEKFDVVQRPTKDTRPIGGRGEEVEIEVTGISTNRINADTHGIPMPDVTNWTHAQIRNIVQYNANGNPQRYRENPTILNEFMFDAATRDFVLGENSDPRRWHVFRVKLL